MAFNGLPDAGVA